MTAFGERLFGAGLLTWFVGALSSGNGFPIDMALGALAVVVGGILIDLGSPQPKESEP